MIRPAIIALGLLSEGLGAYALLTRDLNGPGIALACALMAWGFFVIIAEGIGDDDD